MSIEERITEREADAFEAVRQDRELLSRYPKIKALLDIGVSECRACCLARIVADHRVKNHSNIAF